VLRWVEEIEMLGKRKTERARKSERYSEARFIDIKSE